MKKGFMRGDAAMGRIEPSLPCRSKKCSVF
jgi:hypothetical protein